MKKSRLNFVYENLLPLVIVSIALIAGFYLYLTFIGIPRTQARNYYNQAVDEMDKGNNTKALEYVNEGLKYWNEPYLNDLKQKITK